MGYECETVTLSAEDDISLIDLGDDDMVRSGSVVFVCRWLQIALILRGPLG